MFSWEFCEIFKNIFFTEHLPATASELTRIVKRRSRNILITPKEKLSSLRSSFQGLFSEKGVLKNFAKFTGKHLCQSLFFNKVVGVRSVTLLKKRLWHKRSPVHFMQFLRTPFFYKTPLVPAFTAYNKIETVHIKFQIKSQ